MTEEQSSISLNPTLRKAMMLDVGQHCTISIGKRKITAIISEDQAELNDDATVTFVPDGLARQLAIPSGQNLKMIKDNNIVKLGPLVGILGGAYNKERSSFGSQNSFFRSLLMALKDINGIGYVFTHRDVDWKRELIKGYYINKDKNESWKRMWFPFPDVCYNRYFSGGQSNSYNTLNRLAKHNVKSFNTGGISKWNNYLLIKKKADIAPHLPDTRIFNSSKVLTTMIAKYGGVYIKPANGSKGQGISRITRNGPYYFLKRTNDTNGLKYLSPQEAFKNARINGHSSSLIVQPFIRVPEGGPHFDIRVLVQKNRYSTWVVTGMAARVGGQGKITSNLHTGGQAEHPDMILRDRGFSESQIFNVRNEINRLSISIAETTDRSDRPFGELGLDFIIDGHGKPWFLEANPKPGRRSFGLIDSELRKAAVSRPMEYACYLAGF